MIVSFFLRKISRLEDDVLQLKQMLLDFMAEGKPRVNREAETDFVASMVTQHDQDITNLISDVQGLKELTGSTFVRWGRNECPDNATLVYRGFTSASHYDDTASTPNRLCLTDTPGFDSTDMYGDFYQRVFGAEYFVTGPNHTVVPCAVCRTPQPTTIMVPGTWNCSEGWDTQYIGHIIGHFFTDIRASEYICLDAEPEDADGNEAGWDSGLAMFQEN
ncbi:hypothetical protein C0Q70_05796 [Pomacea canaliculata]|uniref:Uncharacterized protein n=1 Tax=Pomacea canaliculata TaxID=400727 RepID=A0A2T7PM72_POMCA|nr:hypothetical protein C0Q70_05796 [Pomacea canaliculata]